MRDRIKVTLLRKNNKRFTIGLDPGIKPKPLLVITNIDDDRREYFLQDVELSTHYTEVPVNDCIELDSETLMDYPLDTEEFSRFETIITGAYVEFAKHEISFAVDGSFDERGVSVSLFWHQTNEKIDATLRIPIDVVRTLLDLGNHFVARDALRTRFTTDLITLAPKLIKVVQAT